MQDVLPGNSLTSAGLTKPVIFFDDVCVMCNSFVNLLLKVDRKEQFLFAPLNGETASGLQYHVHGRSTGLKIRSSR